MIEEWRPIPNYQNYWASNFGKIKRGEYTDILGRTWKEKLLRIKGRFVYGLKCDSKYFDVSVARLILLTFVGNPPKDKPLACHSDDNVLNNLLTNLYWGSKSDNGKDAFKNGRNKITEKQRRQISNSLKGHLVSKETRRKLSKKAKIQNQRHNKNNGQFTSEAVAPLPEGYR